MRKRSEDFSTVWSTDGGSCLVETNTSDTLAPDGNQTADKLTSNGDSAKIQQQVAGLTDGGTSTLYVWAKVASKDAIRHYSRLHPALLQPVIERNNP